MRRAPTVSDARVRFKFSTRNETKMKRVLARAQQGDGCHHRPLTPGRGRKPIVNGRGQVGLMHGIIASMLSLAGAFREMAHLRHRIPGAPGPPAATPRDDDEGPPSSSQPTTIANDDATSGEAARMGPQQQQQQQRPQRERDIVIPVLVSRRMCASMPHAFSDPGVLLRHRWPSLSQLTRSWPF